MAPPPDDAQRAWPRPAGFWLLQGGGWLLFAAAMSLGRVGEWPGAVIAAVEWPFAILGFLTTLALERLFGRLPLATTTPARMLLILAGASWAAGMLWTALFHTYLHQVAIPLLPSLSPGEVPTFRRGPLLDNTVYNSLTLLAWCTLRAVLSYRDALFHERTEALQAQAAARDAQLQMLAYQLNPHFLFNTLNSLRALIDEDRVRARGMVTALAGFLRYSLLDRPMHLARLSEEVQALEGYLAIERIRFEERLDVQVDIPEDAAACMVPAFLLNPLVENALKHGAPDAGDGPLRVRITARSTGGGHLRLVVENTGHLGRGAAGPLAGNGAAALVGGTQVGLRNVRERLHHLYPGAHHVELTERDGWVTTAVELPATEGS